MRSVIRTIPSISKASPFLALLTAGYIYDQHDKRDIDTIELQKAYQSLEHLDAINKRLQSKTISSSSSEDPTTPLTKSCILQSHLDNIHTHGITVIRSVLSKNEATKWDNIVVNQISKNDGTCAKPIGGSRGRIHCQLVKRNIKRMRRGKDDDINKLYDALVQISNKSINNHEENGSNMNLNDISYEYFKSHNIQKYKLSQLQLLDAIPNSTNQIWHRDNVNPGLTILIALRDVGCNGPTELILQSHDVGKMKLLFKNSNMLPRILLASIGMGDAICYDSRLLHRGRGYKKNVTNNDSSIRDRRRRPVLVIRWDAVDTPAPGTRMIGTQMNKIEGKFLALICTLLGYFS